MEATPWCKQDPQVLDRLIQAQYIRATFYYVGVTFGQGFKDYKIPILTA